MVQIVSAYFGDEKSFRNITDSLLGKITNGSLNVVADEKLLPVFEAAPKTELTSDDERVVRQQAVKACGGEADQRCIQATVSKLQQEALKEKEVQENSKTILKGRRLTLNVVDETGRVKQIIAPDGQKVSLSNVSGFSSKPAEFKLPSVDDMYTQALTFAGIVFASFVYVFSIAAVYAIFMRQYEQTGKDSFRMMAYGLSAVSAVLPYSGYFIILAYFGFNSFLREYNA